VPVSDRYSRSPRERYLGYLRYLEARDPETSPDRLRELTIDEVPPVRLWASRNPRCPPDALQAMVVRGDTSSWALGNPSTPESALRYLSEAESRGQSQRDHPLTLIRSQCLLHPNAGRAFRRELRRQGVKPSEFGWLKVGIERRS